MSTFTFTFPDVLDKKGRRVKNATIEAWRADTHVLVESQITDSDGTATFTLLPTGIDESFHVTWGKNEFWAHIPWAQISAGGTSGTTPDDARDELGIDAELIKWELVFGD